MCPCKEWAQEVGYLVGITTGGSPTSFMLYTILKTITNAHKILVDNGYTHNHIQDNMDLSIKEINQIESEGLIFLRSLTGYRIFCEIKSKRIIKKTIIYNSNEKN